MLSRHPCTPHSLLSPYSPVRSSLPSSSPLTISHNSCQCPLEEKWCLSKTTYFSLSGSVCALKSPSLTTSYPTTTTTTIPSYLLPLPLSAFEACTTLHSGRQADRGQWWWRISCLPAVHMWRSQVAFIISSDRYTDSTTVHESPDSRTHTQTDRRDWGVHMMLVQEQTLQINDQVKVMGFF